MNPLNYISLITWTICLFPVFTVSADLLVLARDQQAGAFSLNSLIIRHVEYRPFRFPENMNKYNLVWTHIPEGGALTLCFPDLWTISTTEMTLLSEDESQESESDKHCKRLVFLETSGMTQLQIAITASKLLPPPVFHNLDFKGVIAFEPWGVNVPYALPLNSYALRNIVVHLQKNKTGNAVSIPGCDTDSSPALVSASCYGCVDKFDFFDQKRPPAIPLPGPGSEMTLTLVLPESSACSPNSGALIHVEILSPFNEPITLTLTHDEALKLREADILTKPSALLSYLQRRSNGLRHWFNQREVLEDVLNAEAQETDSDIHERYINNLIASLDMLSVTITPDDPLNGSMPVGGIIGAMMGDKSGKQGDSARDGNQGTSPLSLRRRPTGSAEKPATPPERARKEGEGEDEPERQFKEQEATERPILDIRRILSQCHFDQYFSLQPDYVLAGLYIYGQLTLEQLHRLLAYDPIANIYSLESALSGDDLISVLEEGDNASRAASMSVLRWLNREQQTSLYHGTVSYAPEEWREAIKKAPDTPMEAFRNQPSRMLAHMLLPHTRNMRLYNQLARLGYIPEMPLKSPVTGAYPLMLLIVKNANADTATHSQILSDLTILLPNSLIPADHLQPQEGYTGMGDSKDDDLTSLTDTGTSNSSSINLEDKRSIIKALLEGDGVSSDTLDAISRFQLLDESRVNQILDVDVDVKKRLKELLILTQECQNNYNKTQLALSTWGYSEQAIKALDQFLDWQVCDKFAKAFDDNADEVAPTLTNMLRSFNIHLKMRHIKFPQLVGELRTDEQWQAYDTERASIQQSQELIEHKELNSYVLRLAEQLAENNFRASRRNILWDFSFDVEISKVAKRKLNIHDQAFDLLTGETSLTTLTTAIKTLVKHRAEQFLKQKIEQQRRIDEGREGWCEWIMRIILG